LRERDYADRFIERQIGQMGNSDLDRLFIRDIDRSRSVEETALVARFML
jgi:hypothetical protein